MLKPEKWTEPKKILVMLAHPDDPEFFCGATIARWAQAGHEIHYCLFTRGDKGADDPNTNPATLAKTREKEELAAAAVLGVKSVQFLDFPDGYLMPDLEARKAATRAIRTVRPNILVTCDPSSRFHRDNYLNHPDHLAAGQIALEAAFPAAGNPLFFPELLKKEKLEPVSLEEIWVSLATDPNVIIDVSDQWATKVAALKEHKSQIGDPTEFEKHMREDRKSPRSTAKKPKYEEAFRRLVF
jgi:LmbE family N-acetylglucosaminyl deacetylase